MANKSEHIVLLAKELLDDLELSRLSGEQLLFKCSRLARFTGSEEIQYWLSLELSGYNSSNEVSLKYMSKTGRWTDFEAKKGYWAPLAQIEGLQEAQQTKLKTMSTPDTSGDWAFRVMQMYENQVNASANLIGVFSGIKSRVMALLHGFVASVYYEKEFEGLAESIFDQYKNEVDVLIAEHCGNVLKQIPAVINRLSDGEGESVSQALVTARRIIESFADSVFPPSDGVVEINGNELSLGPNRHLNRINAYLHERESSKGRKNKIRQNLSNLYERVSAGVHSDVTVEEARSLFLNTYLLLGEILSLKK